MMNEMVWSVLFAGLALCVTLSAMSGAGTVARPYGAPGGSRGWDAGVRAGLRALAWLAGVVVVVWGVWLAMPGSWTAKVPRGVVWLMLQGYAPAPAGPGTVPGRALPIPDDGLRGSRRAWDRYVWQHQSLAAVGRWTDAVLAGSGPIGDEELERLVRPAQEAHALYQQAGGLMNGEGWVIDSAKRALETRLRSESDPHRLVRLRWALAELQFEGGGYSHRSDFARIPDELIERALGHRSEAVRMFGLSAFGRRAHEVVMDGAAPWPPGRERLARLAAEDPSPTVRELAKRVDEYVSAFVK